MMQYFCQVCSQFDIEHDTDNLNVKSEFKKLKAFDFQKKLRGLDGCGHLQALLISYRKRALYKNMGKYQNSKGKINIRIHF